MRRELVYPLDAAKLMFLAMVLNVWFYIPVVDPRLTDLFNGFRFMMRRGAQPMFCCVRPISLLDIDRQRRSAGQR